MHKLVLINNFLKVCCRRDFSYGQGTLLVRASIFHVTSTFSPKCIAMQRNNPDHQRQMTLPCSRILRT